jgi:chemotaxis protein methyltransferase CheR
MDKQSQNQNIELKLLMEAIDLKYGYDFRNYAQASIRRQILQLLDDSGLNSISELQHKILYDEKYFEQLLIYLSIHVTEMFRDPGVYQAIREKVLPLLKEHAHVKIWHAGCSTGEEVYSLAILLHEEGLYNRTQIYATDFNEAIIKKAREGIYPLGCMKGYIINYQKSGGRGAFTDYYTARYEFVKMRSYLKTNIVFSDHNLVTDGVFGEMDLIFCRNVLIYFNRDLQNRVMRLFRDSLYPGGFLCIGAQESVRFTAYSQEFEDYVKNAKIYRKKAELPESVAGSE